MQSQPLFSVLIANYNNGKYLMDAIESVRQQTYTNWEIILVDDASTDNSRELYKELEKDERIHIYYNDKNHGCAYTKHMCATKANGVYCGYLDPDDELLSNALYDSVSSLSKSNDNVLSFSRFYMCDAQMNIVNEARKLDLNGLSYLERGDYSPEHFAVFRRSAYEQTGGLDTSLKAAVDQDLYFRLEEQGKIVVIDKLTYKYRNSPTSLSSRKFWCDYWNIILRHQTCIRRGLPVDDISFNDFQNIILASANEEVKAAILDKENEIRSSRAYRLGKMLLKPFKWLRK